MAPYFFNRFTAMVLVLVWSIPLISQESFFTSIPDDISSPIEMDITVDLKGIIKKKRDEVYFDAMVKYPLADGTILEKKGKIKARGNSRKEICYFPPLKLKLKKRGLQQEDWLPFNKYKLVVQCKSNEASLQYVGKELLAYKVYNHLSEASLKAKPIKYNFIDPDTKEVTHQLNGFIIEDIEELATRLNGQVVERKRYLPSQLDVESYRIMSFFQMFIGNTDWHVGNLHNLKLIKEPEKVKVTPIPYDFDYSGLVNAHYATVHETIPVPHVTVRHYMGPNCKLPELESIRTNLVNKKEAIFKLVSDYQLIGEKYKKVVNGYLEDFFDLIEHPKKSKRTFVKK